MNYQSLINQYNIQSIKELNILFWEEIAYKWIHTYKTTSTNYGTITLQNFSGYAFIIDDGNQLRNRQSLEKEILESRVVGAFGIANKKINPKNRNTMRRWIGKTTEVFRAYGNNYDKGHFIGHSFGGPIDVNLFPQISHINRGLSNEGKKYRNMEKFISLNPGTFVFSRPIYNDLSFCPYLLEFGYCDASLRFNFKLFSNK